MEAVQDQDQENDNEIPNKTELLLLLNYNVFDWLFLNRPSMFPVCTQYSIQGIGIGILNVNVVNKLGNKSQISQLRSSSPSPVIKSMNSFALI